jgi:DNA polymerase I-like protein with 3'-5' exonuclease and polymerase domains
LLAHYLYRFDNGAYAKACLSGDIHTFNQNLAGLPTRDQAKTWAYALIYGAGVDLLGSHLGGGAREGTISKNKFMKNCLGYATLLDRVKRFRKQNKNFIRGLDGRMIPVDSEHTILNYLLQSAGGILAKEWIREFHRLCSEAGYVHGRDYYQMLWVHDELQVSVKEELAETIGQLCVKAIESAGEIHKLNIPITGEFKIGQNWKDCH